MRRVAGASIIALGVVGLVILLAPSVPAMGGKRFAFAASTST